MRKRKSSQDLSDLGPCSYYLSITIQQNRIPSQPRGISYYNYRFWEVLCEQINLDFFEPIELRCIIQGQLPLRAGVWKQLLRMTFQSERTTQYMRETSEDCNV